MQDNLEAVIRVMQYIYDNIMYAELNTKSDYCQCCGYDGEIRSWRMTAQLVWECPNCGNRDQSKMNVARPHLWLHRHPVLEPGYAPKRSRIGAAPVARRSSAGHCKETGLRLTDGCIAGHARHCPAYRSLFVNYANIKYCDIANGVGCAHPTLFVSGCRLHCPNCFNSEAWDFTPASRSPPLVEDEILQSLAPAHIDGLSVLGGEPMEPENQAGLVDFLERVRATLSRRRTSGCTQVTPGSSSPRARGISMTPTASLPRSTSLSTAPSYRMTTTSRFAFADRATSASSTFSRIACCRRGRALEGQAHLLHAHDVANPSTPRCLLP